MSSNDASVWVLLAPSLATLIIAIGSFVKSAAAARFGLKAVAAVDGLHRQMNGNREDELNRAGAAGKSEGVIEGREYSCASAAVAIAAVEARGRESMELATAKALAAVESAAAKAMAIVATAEVNALKIVATAETKAAEVLARAERK